MKGIPISIGILLVFTIMNLINIGESRLFMTPNNWLIQNINSFLCMANVICTSEINVTTYTVFLYISAEIRKYGTCTVSAAKNQFIR